MGAHLELVIKTRRMVQEEIDKFLDGLNSHWEDEGWRTFVKFEEIDKYSVITYKFGMEWGLEDVNKPENETWFGEMQHPKVSHWGLDLDKDREDPEHWVGLVYKYCRDNLDDFEIKELLWG